MKLNKIILVLIIPFLLTGCANVTYNLEIEKNSKINEEVFITGTSTYFANFYKNLPITIVKEYYNDKERLKPLIDSNYNYQLIEDVKYPGILAKKQYSSLQEYRDETVFKGQSFEDIEITEDGNLVTLKTKNFLPYIEDVTDLRYPISKLKVNIKVNYVVTDSNADSYDNKTNTYTWNIDSNTTDKEIKLTFNKNKIYVYNFITYISIVIILIIVIILGIILRKLFIKKKNNDKIME